MFLILFLMVSTVKHCKGDIWIGWDDGWEHHEFDAGNGNVTIVNHSGIDIGNPKQYNFNWWDSVTISARRSRTNSEGGSSGVDYDNARYWYYAYTWNGTHRNRLAIYYISGYPGHYYNPDDIVAWGRGKIGCPYNDNLFDWNRDDKFYCHQLVYRAFINVADIILDDGDDWPDIPGNIIEALDLAHSEPSRRRCWDYNFTLSGGLPPEPKEPIEALTVNLLSELEGKNNEIPSSLSQHFEGAVYGLFKSSERRFFENDEIAYDSILYYLNIAVQEPGNIPKLNGIRGKIIALVHQIMNEKEMAKNLSKGMNEFTYNIPSEFDVKIENISKENVLNIKLNLPFPNDFDYKIIDMTGRTIRKGKVCGIKQGRSEISISLENIPDGNYIFYLRCGKEEKTEKIIISR